ncbi:MAG: excinuclease ABC subunit UvrA [Candidatus Latescibacteria bacterium]|nr:excinuclease ABC subunit UvrA [Candidatus Latescibacterota bacterium]
METRDLLVKGARVHNLAGVDLQLPKNQLICFTGVSGSGKSSMAFDTLYAEGQRRYMASLSAYARQFLGQVEKPDADLISGLSPTISIAQKTGGQNPRSTVGTITEIYDYLRVLFARVGTPHCVGCGRPIGAQTREQIAARINGLPPGERLHVLAPLVQERKGEYHEFFAELQQDGYLRVRVDGRIFNLDEAPQLDRYSRHNIDLVIDRLVVGESGSSRLAEAVDHALRQGKGSLVVAREGQPDWLLSVNFDCPSCGISYQEPTPQMFSFNNPQGMCPSCHGLGTKVVMNEELLVPDPSKSILAGAVEPLGEVKSNKWRLHLYAGAARHLGFSLDTPWKKLSVLQKEGFLQGLGEERIEFTYTNQGGHSWSHRDRYEGVLSQLEERFHRSDRVRQSLEGYMSAQLCPTCKGGRLRPEALAVRLGGIDMPALTRLPIEEARAFFRQLQLDPTQELIGEDALKEIRGRLDLLADIGLGYLSLDRGAHTLSGGEAQRIRLASQIGSGLVGVLYVLDEPSIGLHYRDNQRLLDTLKRLRDIGNTVVVVEHDEETIRQADLVVDFGPGAGERGGQVVVAGTPGEVAACGESLTGQYLCGKRAIQIPEERRSPGEKWLEISGATHHNLKNLDVAIPLGVFTCVTGVSGSGKSSLVNDILFKALDQQLHHAQEAPGAHRTLRGAEHLDKVIRIDQKPIGRTPRSNPATYTDVFTPIRQLFAQLPDSRVRGFKQGHFSFNVSGGRCEACEGNGAHLVEMEFLADVWVRCEACEGRRFNRETLAVEFKDRTIAQVLDMEVEEALRFFAPIPPIRRILQTLDEVGLGYIKLGQPAPTLSGGEAQRVKLAKELCRHSTGRTLYLLDEPTTGLHFADTERLLHVLHTFADQGNTVVVIEHNMEVVKTADYIIDLGPEGGAEGGRLVASGTPEEVARVKDSHTGRALCTIFGHQPVRPAARKGAMKKARAGEGWIREIEVVGARMHNLKGVNARIPRESLTVVSGVSGSGKSTLAFDTLYAEGQRRYVESLSAYARQFLDQMQKPKVERITGLSPAIAIEQKSPSKNPRSTVGTVTEIYDHLRALFAVLGVQHCPRCQAPAGAQTAQQMVDRILRLPEGRRILVLAPLEPARHEGYEALLRRARHEGFNRVRVDGQVCELGAEPQLDRRLRHRVEVVVDRLSVRQRERSRLHESVERALALSGGELVIASPEDEGQERYSRRFSCPQCGRSFEPLVPQSFSFNHQQGMCPDCEGLGLSEGLDREALVPDRSLSLRQGAVAVWGPLEDAQFASFLAEAGQVLGFDLDTPFGELGAEGRQALLYGAPERRIPMESGLSFLYRGVLPAVDEFVRAHGRHRSLLRPVPCSSCAGTRLKPESRAVRLRGQTMEALTSSAVADNLRFFEDFALDPREREVAGELLQGVCSRLRFLERVGLGYIALDRRSSTLSGGESQRIRLASQIGSGLTGVLYLLDEPTIGLHPRDTRRLLDALGELKALGNTLVVVEHDLETIQSADYLLDLGPGAGTQGGELVACGPPDRLGRAPRSKTAAYLKGKLGIPVPAHRRQGKGFFLQVRGARQHNLKNIDVDFPLGTLICITGVSGSGKSTLVDDILYNALAARLNGASRPAGDFRQLLGLEHLDKVIYIDQAPIGHSPRSTPATVMGVFDLIRQLYAQLPEAKLRGFSAGRFSFNRSGGRCESCEGLGWKCIEMHFLPDVWVRCAACQGKRYIGEVLEVRFKGFTIAEVLEMTVDQALQLFNGVPRIRECLQVMADVGLGYLSLGQSSTTLSGGEAQRLKLAEELSRPSTGRTIYLMDEPTTGLHFADIEKLLQVMQRLVDAGNTLIVVEHNLDVIKTADHLIDLGPEGGDQGGEVIACGSPEKVARVRGSYTGKFLRKILA